MSSSANTLQFPRSVLKKFILLYRAEACLWDKNNPFYKNRRHRLLALNKLRDLARESHPDAGLDHVKRKIDCLRASVRREMRKIERLKHSDEDRVPQLWYFDLMKFSIDSAAMSAEVGEEKSVEKNANTTFMQKDPDGIYICPDDDFDADVDVSYSNDDFDVEFDESGNVDALDSSTYSAKLSTSSGSHLAESATVKQPQPGTSFGDEYDAIGVNVAAKLRNLPANMRIMAEKLLNDVLYQAQMNSLTPSTSIVVHDPFKSESR